MEIIDLTALPRPLHQRLHEIADGSLAEYNHLIARLARGNEHKLEWWVTEIASRNTMSSPLFRYCCQLGLIAELASAGQLPPKIIAPSAAMQKVLERFFREQRLAISCEFKKTPPNILSAIKRLLRRSMQIISLPYLKQYVRLVLHFLRSRYLAKKTLASARPFNPTKPLTLVDVYFGENNLSSGSFRDTYYPGLWAQLSPAEKESFYYLPTFHGFLDQEQAFTEARRARENFLIKEDLLKLRDYLFAFFSPWKTLSLRFQDTYFRGFDLAPLLREELRQASILDSSWDAILKYRLVKRLREQGVQLRLVINWFENQAKDKSLNLALKKFFPGVEVLGYQGYIPTQYHLSLYPTFLEKKSNVLPDRLVVIGRALEVSAKKFCPELEVEIGPGFRFKYIWDQRKFHPDQDRFTILLTLPYSLAESSALLGLVRIFLARHTADARYRYLIKPHPDNSTENTKGSFQPEWPEQFELSNAPLNDLLEKADLLISTSSTSCMEALAKGLPVIVVGNTQGLTYNTIPDELRDDIWTLCFTAEELEKAIIFYEQNNNANKERYGQIGNKVRDGYFEPFSKDLVRKFLRL